MKQKSISVTKLAQMCGVCEASIYRMRTLKPTSIDPSNMIWATLTALPDVISKTFSQDAPITAAKPVYLPQHLDETYDPDSIGNIRLASTMKARLPCHKTEEEIDRMWEYKRMFGRGGGNYVPRVP
jgi:hypothetical protein